VFHILGSILPSATTIDKGFPMDDCPTRSKAIEELEVDFKLDFKLHNLI
jgi:hypothetical protein